MPTDVGGFDPLSVSLRDYVDGMQVQRDLAATGHSDRHSAEHAAHADIHSLEQEAVGKLAELVAAQRTEDAQSVSVALEAVQRAAQIHAVAHEQQHSAHQAIHDVEKEAIVKATEQMDKRLYAMNEYRSQLRDQAASFIGTEVFNTKMVALERITDDLRSRQVEVTTRVTSLEVGLATKAQAGDTTGRYAMAIVGFAVTFIVTAVVIISNLVIRQ